MPQGESLRRERAVTQHGRRETAGDGGANMPTHRSALFAQQPEVRGTKSIGPCGSVRAGATREAAGCAHSDEESVSWTHANGSKWHPDPSGQIPARHWSALIKGRVEAGACGGMDAGTLGCGRGDGRGKRAGDGRCDVAAIKFGV